MIEVAAIAIALLLTLLITAMIMQLITAREHRDIAIKKAIGLTNNDIRKQYGLRIPAILFLDEPTGALNSTAADQVLAILEDLNRQGMTIMMVTHDPRVAAKARKIIYIRDGQIAANKDLTAAPDSEQELGDWLKSLHATA